MREVGEVVEEVGGGRPVGGQEGGFAGGTGPGGGWVVDAGWVGEEGFCRGVDGLEGEGVVEVEIVGCYGRCLGIVLYEDGWDAWFWRCGLGRPLSREGGLLHGGVASEGDQWCCMSRLTLWRRSESSRGHCVDAKTVALRKRSFDDTSVQAQGLENSQPI